MYGEGLSRLMSGGAPCCFLIVVTSQRLVGTGRGGLVDREFRTSRRALNVLSVRAGLSEQATKPPRPVPTSAWGPVTYRWLMISSILPSRSMELTVLGANRWLPLWTGSPQTVPSPSMTDRHMKGQRWSRVLLPLTRTRSTV